MRKEGGLDKKRIIIITVILVLVVTAIIVVPIVMEKKENKSLVTRRKTSGNIVASLDSEPSKGLEYVLSGGGEGYLVKGMGTCEEKGIVIASSYEGKPVIGIADRAFKDTSLTTVYIPKSVMTIGEEAFAGCSELILVVYAGENGEWNALAKGDKWDDGAGEYDVICEKKSAEPADPEEN